MKTLKTINVDMVKEAFAEAGIEPKQGVMCQCVMAAICYPKNNFEDFVLDGFDRDYVYGVMDGWDHVKSTKSNWHIVADYSSLEYKLGREHGTRAKEIMLPSAV